jgi:hypothetical protein
LWRRKAHAKVRHVALYAGYISSDLLYRRSQLRITTPRYQPRRWARIGAPRYVALALAAVLQNIPLDASPPPNRFRISGLVGSCSKGRARALIDGSCARFSFGKAVVDNIIDMRPKIDLVKR